MTDKAYLGRRYDLSNELAGTIFASRSLTSSPYVAPHRSRSDRVPTTSSNARVLWQKWRCPVRSDSAVSFGGSWPSSSAMHSTFSRLNVFKRGYTVGRPFSDFARKGHVLKSRSSFSSLVDAVFLTFDDPHPARHPFAFEAMIIALSAIDIVRKISGEVHWFDTKKCNQSYPLKTPSVHSAAAVERVSKRSPDANPSLANTLKLCRINRKSRLVYSSH